MNALKRAHKVFWFHYRVNKKSEHVIAPGLAKFYAESYKRAFCICWVLNIKSFWSWYAFSA